MGNYKVIYTTDRVYRKRILHAEIAYLIKDKLATILYLGMDETIIGLNGIDVPLNHDKGSYRRDAPTLSVANLPTELSISKAYNNVFVHAFIINNFSTSTPQGVYQDVLSQSVKTDYGFDFGSINPVNLAIKKAEFQKIVEYKDLESRWSCWMHPTKALWCYGPNGEYLKIL